ncbi:hypothetical protein NIES3585_47130 [Nodularia sp. NIES-3585]|nr:hypothetical protein NIES3585_47130 [Nodularia sp. NIES-3585]
MGYYGYNNVGDDLLYKKPEEFILNESKTFQESLEKFLQLT